MAARGVAAEADGTTNDATAHTFKELLAIAEDVAREVTPVGVESLVEGGDGWEVEGQSGGWFAAHSIPGRGTDEEGKQNQDAFLCLPEVFDRRSVEIHPAHSRGVNSQT